MAAGDEETVSKQIAKIQSDLDLHRKSASPKSKTSAKAPLYKETTKKAKKQSCLRKISHFLPQAVLSKSAICQHEYGCFENVVRKALKHFLVGFFIQVMLKNLMLLAKPAKLLKNL